MCKVRYTRDTSKINVWSIQCNLKLFRYSTHLYKFVDILNQFSDLHCLSIDMESLINDLLSHRFCCTLQTFFLNKFNWVGCGSLSHKICLLMQTALISKQIWNLEKFIFFFMKKRRKFFSVVSVQFLINWFLTVSI